MYVSRAVRSMQDNPVADATVTLLLEVDAETATATVRGELENIAGIEVLAEHRFDTLRVRLEQEQIEAVCAIGGLAAVETDDTLVLDAGGAGEDVEF